MLRFGYNTNGCSNHRLGDALELISEAGYSGVALTLDHHHLDPFADDYERQAEALKSRLAELDLALVVETGARYLMDPREKHEPTLLHPTEEGRARRLDFLKRAIRIAEICEAEAVSFFAGRPRRNVSQANAGAWLLDGLVQIADMGAQANVCVALEPEPGHIVATLDDFKLVREAVKQTTDSPLHLALDLGHCLVTGDREPHMAVKEFAAVLGTVSIEDMRRGVHEHLPFGEGDMDVPTVLGVLDEVGFEKLVCVELSRDSHRAHELIPASLDYLMDNLPSD